MKKKIDFKNLFKNLGKTWKYVRKYRKNLIGYIIISLLIAGVGVVAPYFTSKLLLYLTDGEFNLLLLISFDSFFRFLSRKNGRIKIFHADT